MLCEHLQYPTKSIKENKTNCYYKINQEQLDNHGIFTVNTLNHLRTIVSKDVSELLKNRQGDTILVNHNVLLPFGGHR